MLVLGLHGSIISANIYPDNTWHSALAKVKNVSDAVLEVGIMSLRMKGLSSQSCLPPIDRLGELLRQSSKAQRPVNGELGEAGNVTTDARTFAAKAFELKRMVQPYEQNLLRNR
jgi:hypothetical protein